MINVVEMALQSNTFAERCNRERMKLAFALFDVETAHSRFAVLDQVQTGRVPLDPASDANTTAPGSRRPLAGMMLGSRLLPVSSLDPRIPSLAGQQTAYLSIQLVQYRDQRRKDPAMSAIADW